MVRTGTERSMRKPTDTSKCEGTMETTEAIYTHDEKVDQNKMECRTCA